MLGEDIIKKAAAKVPSWVPYLFFLVGGPSLGTLYVTAQSVWHTPQDIAALQTKVDQQSKDIAEIKALLQHPTTQPK